MFLCTTVKCEITIKTIWGLNVCLCVIYLLLGINSNGTCQRHSTLHFDSLQYCAVDYRRETQTFRGFFPSFFNISFPSQHRYSNPSCVSLSDPPEHAASASDQSEDFSAWGFIQFRSRQETIRHTRRLIQGEHSEGSWHTMDKTKLQIKTLFQSLCGE